MKKKSKVKVTRINDNSVTTAKVAEAKKPKCDCTGAVVITALASAALYVILTFGGKLLPSGPKFEKGDCAIDRSYQPIRIDYVWKFSKTYDVKTQSIGQISDGWYLYNNSDVPSREKSIDYVDRFYVKVDCRNWNL